MACIDEDLEKVRKFLDENNIKLSFTDYDDNYIDHHQDEIVVYRGQSKKHKLFTILHEIGHYFLELHFDEETKATTIIQEVLAWDRGFDVSAALNLDIDEDEWKKLMESSISKYLSY